MHRHDLVFLSSEQTITILDNTDSYVVAYVEAMQQKGIPFTVCRQNLPGMLKLSTSCLIDDKKYRTTVMTEASNHRIERPVALSLILPILPVSIHDELMAFINTCEAFDVNVYVYGSFSNQYLTHLPFVTSQSDLDILIDINETNKLLEILSILETTKHKLMNRIGLKIDGELRANDTHDISFNELIQCLNQNTSTIVVKNLHTIEIKRIDELFEWSPNELRSFRENFREKTQHYSR